MKKDTNRIKFEEVAKLLGFEVDKYNPENNWADTMRKGDLKIFCRFNSYRNKGKWELSSSVDRSNLVYISADVKNSLTLSINVSETKNAHQIARDIENRLLIDSLAYMEHVKEKLKSHDDYTNTIEKNKLKLLAIPGIEPCQGSAETLRLNLTSEGYGTLQVSRDSVSFDLRSIPFDLAEKILKIMVKS